MTHGITQIEKVIYTAKAHTMGGRDGGSCYTLVKDRRLHFHKLAPVVNG